MILFVDDMQERYIQLCARHPEEVIAFAQTIIIAREMLVANEYDQVFLDQDMCEEDYLYETVGHGQQLATWMVANKEKIGDPVIVIHSMNPFGAKKMEQILQGHFTDIHRVSFGAFL